MFACFRARFTLLPSSDSVIAQPDYRSTAHQRQESQGRRARVRSRCTREGMERAVWWGPTGGGSGGTVTRHAPHTGLRRPRSIPCGGPGSRRAGPTLAPLLRRQRWPGIDKADWPLPRAMGLLGVGPTAQRIPFFFFFFSPWGFHLFFFNCRGKNQKSLWAADNNVFFYKSTCITR